MTIQTLKANMVKLLTAGALAGVALVATPQHAQAQVRFGIRIGRPAPVYVAPVPYDGPAFGPAYGAGFYGPRRVYVRHDWREDRGFHRGFYGR